MATGGVLHLGSRRRCYRLTALVKVAQSKKLLRPARPVS